jgi:transposase
MAHPRAKLTVAGRRLLVQRVLEQGWPPARAAEAQGVSLATAYKLVRRWQADGMVGLADRSSRPRRCPRQLPAAREQAILADRAAHRVGPHRIGWALGEAHATVHAVLVRHQVPRLWELDRPTGQVVRYQRQRPGELVHLDIKKQGRIPDSGGHRIHGRQRARVASASKGSAMTFCTWLWTTAPGWRIWRSTPMRVRPPWPASPSERWPSTPGWASPSSGS